MGNSQKSALKFPRTRPSNQSLDMHQGYAELGPHPRLCVGSCRLPPGAAVASEGQAEMACLMFTSAILMGVYAAKK